VSLSATLLLDGNSATLPVLHQEGNSRLQRAILIASLVIGGLALAFLASKIALGASERQALSGEPEVRVYFEAPPFDPAKLSVADPDALAEVTPEKALETNALRPLSTLPNPAARSLMILSGDATDSARSLDCMTAALYYEAGFESEEGQRAVAQVVLNRLRHPLYPHTVCGVVFQGSERRTGCQFSFTCDGSLARRPTPAIWDRLRRVAAQALAGYVHTPVGLSTHYHADYVVPYWASSLVKTFTVGRHIFYRINGAYGHPGAFRLAYAGREPDVLSRTSTGQLAVAETGLQMDQVSPTEGVVSAGSRPVLDHRGQVLQLGGDKDPPAGAKSAALTAKPAGSGRLVSERRFVIGMDGQKASITKRPDAAVVAEESDRGAKPAADKANGPGRVALVEPTP
jgi:hypothetical protein